MGDQRGGGGRREDPKAVLLLEPDVDLHDLLAEFLNQIGFIVVPAASPDTALALCSKLAIDVILVDLPAPNPAPVAFLHTLKAANPDTPLVVLTVPPAEDALRQYGDAGAHEVIVRPIEGPKTLEMALRRALRRRGAPGRRPRRARTR